VDDFTKTPQDPGEYATEDKNAAVLENWQRFVQGLLGVLALLGAVLLAHYYAPPSTADLQDQVQHLTQQIADLQQTQHQGALPALQANGLPRPEQFPSEPVADVRNSVAYVCGIYRVSGGMRAESFRARVGGTGFVVGQGLLATNRHVAEPWYRDERAELAMKHGATASLEKLVAYFPGSPAPVELTPASTAKYGDLAVLRMEDTPFSRNLRALPMARTQPRVGEAISVVAYPMGVTGMVAKSPAVVYERLSSHEDDTATAGELAALSLIRPSATFGHIGDVTTEKLIYDAPTARGGSGGPVVNARGEVVGVNSAYIEGFSGGTLGISVTQLVPLIETAKQGVTEAATRARQ
jgi:S1-C subfamily serine protease